MRQALKQARRVVVKVGSALVTQGGAGLDRAALAEWARQISLMIRDGKQVLLVSSGAIAAGMQRLGWQNRPHALHELQAAAAVGQMGLAHTYESAFAEHGLVAAQVLLTHADTADRTRYLNARSTLVTLLELGAVPIINENDTVVTDEIKFGDNDTLGALVANLVDADCLIILTDQTGLFTADPRKDPTATLIHQGTAGHPDYERMAGGAGTGISKGGMLTKIRAAARAARSGAHTLIASGHEPDVLLRLVEGEVLGTFLCATELPATARKRWLSDQVQLSGALVLDDGACHALLTGRSLLPVGVSEVRGDFSRGAVVACLSQSGEELARGLANYAASETRRIAGHPTDHIERLLGYVDEHELIHRDNLMISRPVTP